LPHRFAPLSWGTRVGDTIRCGYHGLGSDTRGRCVHTPFPGEPPTSHVATMPVIERYRALWFWLGDPACADPALIPDFAFIEEPHHV